jgi:hypothetical protein
MAGPLVLRWFLSVAFALAGGYCTTQCVAVLRALGRADPTIVLTNSAHVAMSAAMIGMIWWTPSWRIATWEMAAFALGGGGFAVRVVTLRQHAGSHPTHRGRGHVASTLARSPLACAHYGAAMVAMVWMLMTMAARPGMSGMPGRPGLSVSRALTAAVLAVYFAVAAAIWLVGFRYRRRASGYPAQALMSAAMGTAFLTLAW